MQNSIILQNISRDELFSEISDIITRVIDKKLQPEPRQEYLTKKEVAAKLRLSLPTVQRLTKDGTLTGKRIGRRVLYLSDQVDQALTEIHTIKYKRN